MILLISCVKGFSFWRNFIGSSRKSFRPAEESARNFFRSGLTPLGFITTACRGVSGNQGQTTVSFAAETVSPIAVPALCGIVRIFPARRVFPRPTIPAPRSVYCPAQHCYVTLVPVLMGYFIRGRIPNEQANPLSRLLIWLYLVREQVRLPPGYSLT